MDQLVSCVAIREEEMRKGGEMERECCVKVNFALKSRSEGRVEGRERGIDCWL